MFAVKLMVLLWVIIAFSGLLIKAYMNSLDVKTKLEITLGYYPKWCNRICTCWSMAVVINIILTIWSLIYWLFLR